MRWFLPGRGRRCCWATKKKLFYFNTFHESSWLFKDRILLMVHQKSPYNWVGFPCPTPTRKTTVFFKESQGIARSTPATSIDPQMNEKRFRWSCCQCFFQPWMGWEQNTNDTRTGDKEIRYDLTSCSIGLQDFILEFHQTVCAWSI